MREKSSSLHYEEDNERNDPDDKYHAKKCKDEKSNSIEDDEF